MGYFSSWADMANFCVALGLGGKVVMSWEVRTVVRRSRSSGKER